MKFTPRGRFVAALAILLWGLAFVTANASAVVGAFALTAALAFGLFVLKRPVVKTTRRIPRERFTEGESFEEEMRIRLLSGRRLKATIVESASPGLTSSDRSGIEVVLTREETVSVMRWTAATWGHKSLGPLRIVVRDPLELFEAEDTSPDVQRLLVHPRPLPIGKHRPRASNPEPALGAHTVSKPGDGSEFFALRDYQTGDSIRRINWKASARSGRTIVNQVTRDSYARVVVFVDLRDKETIGNHEESALVRSGRAAASILAHSDRMRDHLTLISVSVEAKRLSITTNPRLGDLLNALAESVPGGHMRLDQAVREHLTAIRSRSPVYFVTSGVLDPEFRDALLIVQALGANPIVVSPEPASGAFTSAAEARVVERSRRIVLDDVRSLGVPVAEWSPDGSLEVALLAT